MPRCETVQSGLYYTLSSAVIFLILAYFNHPKDPISKNNCTKFHPFPQAPATTHLPFSLCKYTCSGHFYKGITHCVAFLSGFFNLPSSQGLKVLNALVYINFSFFYTAE